MLQIKEEELNKILPADGPSIDEVKRYLEKYNDEYIVIKCGGSVLVDQNLFNISVKPQPIFQTASRRDSPHGKRCLLFMNHLNLQTGD